MKVHHSLALIHRATQRKERICEGFLDKILSALPGNAGVGAVYCPGFFNPAHGSGYSLTYCDGAYHRKLPSGAL